MTSDPLPTDSSVPTATPTVSPISTTTTLTETVVGLRYLGANPVPRAVGLDPLPGIVNYFIGSDSSVWRSQIPTYAQVALQGVYPGIDLVYDGTSGQVEYRWQIAAGADPSQIVLGVDGAQGTSLDAQGDLLIQTATGVIAQQAPLAYQVVDGQQVPVAVQFILGAQGVGFTLGSYDHNLPLVIDPLLSYSTYLGGSGNDSGSGIAVDSTGNAYVVGTTTSNDFTTTTGAFSTTLAGGIDTFVVKLSADGRVRLYSTYLGGKSTDEGTGIAVDSAGDAYIGGWTVSSDFPTSGTLFGSCCVFVTKLIGHTLRFISKGQGELSESRRRRACPFALDDAEVGRLGGQVGHDIGGFTALVSRGEEVQAAVGHLPREGRKRLVRFLGHGVGPVGQHGVEPPGGPEVELPAIGGADPKG